MITGAAEKVVSRVFTELKLQVLVDPTVAKPLLIEEAFYDKLLVCYDGDNIFCVYLLTLAQIG